MWYRVFCQTDAAPSPAELLAALEAAGLRVRGDFRGDDLGWTIADLSLGTSTPVRVERYLTEADDLRDDLNTNLLFVSATVSGNGLGSLTPKVLYNTGTAASPVWTSTVPSDLTTVHGVEVDLNGDGSVTSADVLPAGADLTLNINTTVK